MRRRWGPTAGSAVASAAVRTHLPSAVAPVNLLLLRRLLLRVCSQTTPRSRRSTCSSPTRTTLSQRVNPTDPPTANPARDGLAGSSPVFVYQLNR